MKHKVIGEGVFVTSQFETECDKGIAEIQKHFERCHSDFILSLEKGYYTVRLKWVYGLFKGLRDGKSRTSMVLAIKDATDQLVKHLRTLNQSQFSSDNMVSIDTFRSKEDRSYSKNKKNSYHKVS